jgi:hypothetical protein
MMMLPFSPSERWLDSPPFRPTLRTSEHGILIGLYSKRPRAGKTYLAEQLAIKHGCIRLSYATPIKRMTRSLLRALGIPRNDISLLELDRKDKAILYGKSMRDIWKFLGNEFGKEFISPSIWCDAMRVAIAELHKAQCSRIVIDDVRFPMEFEQIKRLGGVLVRVIGSDDEMKDVPETPTEGLLEDLEFDIVVDNRGKDNHVYVELYDELRRRFFEDL